MKESTHDNSPTLSSTLFIYNINLKVSEGISKEHDMLGYILIEALFCF